VSHWPAARRRQARRVVKLPPWPRPERIKIANARDFAQRLGEAARQVKEQTMTTPARQEPEAVSMTTMEQVVIGGDLGTLAPAQRVAYYRRVCESMGLNPFTKPFAYR
jgi:hypothetical protein